MATGKRYYWIKLKEAFMTSDTVDFLMGQPDGANYVVLYQMLCLKTINTGGKLFRQIGEIIIPYDAEKIQRDCKWFSVDTIRVALNLYKALGLVYEDRDGVLVLTDHQNLVGSETDWAQQKRNKKSTPSNSPQLPNGNNVESEVEIFHTDIRDKILDIRDIENRDKIIDKEKIVSGDKITSKDKKSVEVKENTNTPQAEAEQTVCPYIKIKELYNSICISFPRIRAIDGNRKKAVAARWRSCKSLDTFRDLFTLAESSSFLKGRNERNWSADFDWMMKATNFSKILENKYADRNAPASGALGTLARMYEEAEASDRTRNY